MFMTSPLLALAAAVVAIVPAAQAAMVNTPMGLVQCQPASISWSGASGSGMVYLSIIQGKQVGSQPLVTFTPQTGASGSLTWPKVNVSSGTEITVQINDATGMINYSDQTKILPGDSDCTLVNAASGGSSSSSGSSTTGSSGSGSGSGSSTQSAASSAKTSSGSGSSSSTTSGAMAVSASGAISALAAAGALALATLTL